MARALPAPSEARAHVSAVASGDSPRGPLSAQFRIFRRAVRWGWIDRRPTSEATAPPPSHPEPLPATPAEAARILEEVWKEPDLGPLVWVAMATGARLGELCALRWRHIVVVICSAIAQTGRRVWEKDTELHQRRHIALDPTTSTILDTYREERQRTRRCGRCHTGG